MILIMKVSQYFVILEGRKDSEIEDRITLTCLPTMLTEISFPTYLTTSLTSNVV